MNQQEGAAGSGDAGGAGGEPPDGSAGRARSPRWLVWVALAAAIVVAAVCATNDPEEPEALGQPAGGEPPGESAGAPGGESSGAPGAEPVGAPGGGDPGDCYTTEADQPQHPRDTNRYLVALTAGGAQAGALDEYAHCQSLPAQNPDSADGDCYSTGDDNEWRLTGVNRYGLALLKAGASAGALEKYAHCAYLPAVLDGTGGG